MSDDVEFRDELREKRGLPKEEPKCTNFVPKMYMAGTIEEEVLCKNCGEHFSKHPVDALCSPPTEIDRLRSELEEARKDGERISWLELKGFTVFKTGERYYVAWEGQTCGQCLIEGTIRSAIDAAMSQQKEAK